MKADPEGSDTEPTSDTSTESTDRGGLATHSRRGFIAGSVGTTLGIAGCLGSSQGSSGGSGNDTETVTFQLKPTENPQDVKEQYAPVEKYIEAEVDGITVDTPVGNSYSAVERSLRSGRAEISLGDLVVFAFPDLVDVLGTTNEKGTPFYFSMFATQPEYDVESLTDLKGTKLPFSDPLSTSGSVYPLYALKQAGLDVGDAPTGDAVDFTAVYSNHDQSLQLFMDRDNIKGHGNYADAFLPYVTKSHLQEIGALEKVKEYSAVADKIGTKTDEHELELLWVSDPIPKEPVILRSDWDSPKRDAVEQALLDMTPEDLKQYRSGEGVSLPISELTQTAMEEYNPVRKRVKDLGVLEAQMG